MIYLFYSFILNEPQLFNTLNVNKSEIDFIETRPFYHIYHNNVNKKAYLSLYNLIQLNHKIPFSRKVLHLNFTELDLIEQYNLVRLVIILHYRRYDMMVQ